MTIFRIETGEDKMPVSFIIGFIKETNSKSQTRQCSSVVENSEWVEDSHVWETE